jgi:hypothetical protein
MVTALQAPVNESEEYIDDLWFTLHHSEDDDCLVLGLHCHLDDSGSDDGSLLVTCGGPVMARAQFKEFSRRWSLMYQRNRFVGYDLEPPLHMSDFVNMGKYAGLLPEFKRHFFLDVSRIVNEHKLYSISIAISQTDFNNELSEEVRKNLIGPYAFAFFSVVAANQSLSEMLMERTGPLRFGYLVDLGFGHQEQLVEAHRVVVNNEISSGRFRSTRALTFDADDNVPMLQAADAIAWASRKKELLGTLPEGFEPLEELLREHPTSPPTPHVTIRIPPEGIRMLANPINNWIFKNGAVPKLSDIVKQRLGDLPR